MSNFKRITLEPKSSQRIFVTSDIHGHYGHFVSLLESAGFTNDDLLIIVGDILEKGPNSLSVLRYAMKLYSEGRAIVLLGNVDNRFLWQIDNADITREEAENFLGYLRYMRDWKGTSFYDEMCRELGVLPDSVEDIYETLKYVRTHFKRELDFIRQCPTLLETPKYIFVHGGLPKSEDEVFSAPDSEKNPHEYLKLDNFIALSREKGLKFNRYVVAGHWPCALNNGEIHCNTPIIDKETHIIAIDGGLGIHQCGQLNMLVMPSLDCEPDKIEFRSFDGFDTFTALTGQAESTDMISIRWGDNDVRFLYLDGDAAEIEHIRTGKRLWVPSDFLYTDPKKLSSGDTTRVNTVTDYKLPVAAGDKLSVVRKTSKGILVKKNDTVGWYYGEITE